MFKKHLFVALIIVLTAITGLLSTTAQDGDPVTHYRASTRVVATLDPTVAGDAVSLYAIENLFLGLTDYDPFTAKVVPELAKSWDISDDSTVWTFHLRDDVNWVKYDTETGTFDIKRPVIAPDIEYAIRYRLCNPNLSAYGVPASVILGCDEIKTAEDPETVTEEDFQTVGVRSIDDYTLEITLVGPRAYFLSMTPMWPYRAVPIEVVEEFGKDEWYQPENIWTNGAFGVVEWVRGVHMEMILNPHFPEDMRGPGNVERVVTKVVEDENTQFALYQTDEIDTSVIPSGELDAFLEQNLEQAHQKPDMIVYYFGLELKKPPFDNVHVRRAFAAVFDRQTWVEEVEQSQGLPMIHWAPPGIFGAVPIDEVGIGHPGKSYEEWVEYAQEQMELGGYPNCEGFPTIDIVTYQERGNWFEFLLPDLERYLGCNQNLFNIEEQEYSILNSSVSVTNPVEERPHIYTSRWGPDYPDQNNWVFDVLRCDVPNARRECTEADEIMREAAAEPNQQKRLEMYREVEELLYGEDGEVPMIPIYLSASYSAVKPWFTGPLDTDALFGAARHYDYYDIDVEAQAAARGE